MSDRLAMSTGDISQYHISLSDAHTVLARACLGVLLRDPDVAIRADPLARYAAWHWLTHSQVEGVASRVRDGIEDLFSPDKPYFEAWVQLHQVDPYYFRQGTERQEPGAKPLYYAAFCGFLVHVEHLILKYPQCASAEGGGLGTALHSASYAGHLQVVQSLLQHGVDVDTRGYESRTPLRFASEYGHGDIVQCLIDHGADVNLQDCDQRTPLSWAAHGGHIQAVRTLLEHHADVNSRDDDGDTPLHYVEWGCAVGGVIKGDHLRIVQLLLKHGADVDAMNKDGKTPLEFALEKEQGEIAQLLSEFRSRVSQT